MNGTNTYLTYIWTIYNTLNLIDHFFLETFLNSISNDIVSNNTGFPKAFSISKEMDWTFNDFRFNGLV